MPVQGTRWSATKSNSSNGLSKATKWLRTSGLLDSALRADRTRFGDEEGVEAGWRLGRRHLFGEMATASYAQHGLGLHPLNPRKMAGITHLCPILTHSDSQPACCPIAGKPHTAPR